MRRILQRLLFSLVIVAVTQISTVNAESIRLKGPDGQVQSSPRFSNAQMPAFEPARFYGPTTEQETLWSIASRLRPASDVTVQQTLYAIFQINPQAFANQNIHELIPRSTIRVPSLSQVRSVSTQEAINVMAAHKARLGKSSTAPTLPSSVPANNTMPDKAPQTSQTPKERASDKPAETTDSMAPPSDSSNDVSIAKLVTKEKNKQVKSLETQLESSETELQALEEKNLKLRMMLADVQSEVDVLNDKILGETKIRNEVEKLLEAERQRVEEERQLAPTAMDQLLSSTGLVAALAIIPGLVMGIIIVLLISRRSKEETPPEPY